MSFIPYPLYFFHHFNYSLKKNVKITHYMVHLSISPCISFHYCFIYFEAILLIVEKLKIVISIVNQIFYI